MSVPRTPWRRVVPSTRQVTGRLVAGILSVATLGAPSCGRSEPAVAHGGPSRITQMATIDRFPAGLGPQAARGRTIFLQKCRICHGDEGDGKGFNAFNVEQTFGVRPADFTAIDRWTPELLADARAILVRGGPSRGRSPAMPAWGGRLDADQVEQVLAFLQALSATRESASGENAHEGEGQSDGEGANRNQGNGANDDVDTQEAESGSR